MKIHRSLIAVAVSAALYAASSCSGEDGKRKQPAPPDGSVQAGNGGANSGGSASGGKAGSGGQPQAGTSGGGAGGSSGEGGGSSGEAGTAGEATGGMAGEATGGMAGEATGGMAGEAMGGTAGEAGETTGGMGGEAGTRGASCGVGSQSSCAAVIDGWNPRFDAATGEFRFDTSVLGADIVDGFATFFAWTRDVNDEWLVDGCGLLDGSSFRVESADVVFSAGGAVLADRVTIHAVLLRDACGNEYAFTLDSGSDCSWIEFSPTGGAGTLWPVSCGTDELGCSLQCV